MSLDCSIKKCNQAIISWDGWDSLVEQGIRVLITLRSISWHKIDPENPCEYYHPLIGYTLHRKDLPAYERSDGKKEWWFNGERHRDNDLPAVEDADGSKEWHCRGFPRRAGGLPILTDPDGRGETYHEKLRRIYGKPKIVV